MIEKIIHYCWFGNGKLPSIVIKCIETWKFYLPDYKIILWDENNFDVNQITYTKQAYNLKKYAFVSDYARFNILYNYGGIYLDTDVELLRPLDLFLNNKMFTGFENKERVAPGLILGAEKGSSLMKEMMNIYHDKAYILADDSIDKDNVVSIFTKILLDKGLKLNGCLQSVEDLKIYPVDYFSPKSYFSGKTTITENTISIHHYAGTWVPKYVKVERKFWQFLGMNDYQIFKRLIYKVHKINKTPFKIK